jgi:flagellar protein FlaI
MGLLEKAQQRKQMLVETEDTITPTIVEKEETDKAKPVGLLEKAQQRKQSLKQTSGTEKQEGMYTGLKQQTGGKQDIIEERTDFGWKGLGIRRIVFNHDTSEYQYEVSEPVLTEDEIETKNELTRLFKMLADVDVSGIDKEEKKKYLEETLEQIIIDNDIYFDEGSKDKIFYHLFRNFIGYDRIDIIMEDEGIEDISCDGHHVPIFIYHKKYEAISTNIQFKDMGELDSFVVRLSQICGKQISIYSPIVDGKLPDGSRLQTTLSKTVTKSSTFTIRRFKEDPLTPIDLIRFKSLSVDMAAYFWMAIEKGASILFCGGTASGKTTSLNALSLFIPGSHKIISIEDTREVSLPHKNWIAGTTRQGFSSSDNKTGKDIDMFDLIRAALRQRPRVIIVGEVRGKEAYNLFQAMATGHTSYSTVHASTIHTLIQRLENPPISLPRALLTSLDIIVFQNSVDIGGKMVRRMTSVTEVIKLDPDTNQLIFMEPFRWVSKTDDRFESSGTSKILNTIRLQSDWTEEQLKQELENRKGILEWMEKKNIRDYKDVGRIVSDYQKFPKELLQKALEEMKK